MGRNSQELLGQVKQIESRLVQRIEDVEKNPILQQDQGKGTLVVRLNKIYSVQRVEIDASTVDLAMIKVNLLEAMTSVHLL